MKKSHSLFFSAVLAAMSVFSVTGAPLAADNAARGGGTPLFGTPSVAVTNPQVSWLNNLPSTTATAPNSAGGIRRQFSDMEVQRARAMKSATAASRALATDAELRGWVMWPSTMLGLYILPKTDGGMFLPYGNANTGVINGGGYDDGRGTYHGIYYTTTEGSVGIVQLFHLDAETFDIIGIETLEGGADMVANDVAMDPTTGDVYGCYFSDGGMCWGRGNYTSGVRTAIRQLSQSEWLIAVGCDADGQFYGLTLGSSLVKIDKLTGAFQKIADTDVPYQYMAGGCVDTTTGKFLVTYNTDMIGGGIYEVDLATGESSRAVDFGNNDIVVVGPYIPAGNVGEKVPMAPSLTVSAPSGTMTVSYTIVLPTTLVDGTPIAGDVDWQLMVAGEVKAQGKAEAGKSVAGSITLDKSGMTEFAAVASTPAGRSARAEQMIYVGSGSPAAPANVVASWTDGKMAVSWDAVTTVTDGGYINPSAVRYTVYDAAGTELISGLADTKYEMEVAVPATNTSYSYSVSAQLDGKSSAATLSNVVRLGAYEAPFTTDFNAYDIFDTVGYTIIDANGDGKSWGIRAFGAGAYYTYSSSNAADDWLITPAIRMEAGKVYPFSCIAYCESASDAERIEVKAGRAATAEAMTIEVVPATEITSTKANAVTLYGLIKPDADGDCFVGLHAISDKFKYWLTIPSLTIGAGMAYATPAGVTSLEVTPEASGLLSVTGKFKLPTLDVTGAPLSGNVSVKVMRGQTEVATLSGQPGAELTFSDNAIPAKGEYTYSVVTYLADQVGVSVSASVFVGPYAAATPTGIKVSETDEPGTVTVEWEAVTTDKNGKPIDADNVTYMVYSVDEDKNLVEMLDANVKATSATFKAIADPSVQQFLQFAVTAFNRDAMSESDVRTADMIPVGAPYQMPVLYSGSDSQADYIEYTSARGTGFWGIYDQETITEAPAPKGSDDYYGCYAGAAELYGDLYTGKIDLTGAQRPELSFFTYKFPAGGDWFYTEDVNFLQVVAIVGGQMELLETVNHKDMLEGKWNKVRIDLSAYKGKTIQLMFRAVAKSGSYTFIDEMLVKEVPAKDMVAMSITAPASVQANKQFDVKVTVANHGYLDASDIEVVLYRNGDVAATKQVDFLAADGEETLTFPEVISYFDEDNTGAAYSAEVILAGDEDEANNASEEVTVARPVATTPAVTDLAGDDTAEGVKLTWSVYSPYDLPAVEKTEDFEAARPWEMSYGDWTFLSLSDSPAGYIYGMTLPGIETNVTMCSWYVINNDGAESALPSNLGGQQFIASLLKSDKQANDDWAISPRLYGGAQTISFYAISYNSHNLESFEIWYTTLDSTDPADFVKLEGTDVVTVPYEWTRYQYNLPEGALHFAVRAVSEDCYLLMLDDFTFTPDPLVGAPTLVGYDIYRDGVKLNDAPVNAGEYLDTKATAGRHVYHVVAKYAEGDSELSNPVSIEQSGLDEVSSAAGLNVSVDGRDIVVSGAAGKAVTIVTVDGKVLRRAIGDLRVAVAPAVYLVTVGDTTVKLLVK